MLTYTEVKEKMFATVSDDANAQRDKFCKAFALIANFAGWRWRFDDHAPTLEQIYGTYDSLVDSVIDSCRDFNDDNWSGTVWTTQSSTGRICMTFTYYIPHGTMSFRVTCEISH